MRILLVGPPGAGKGTQAETLARRLDAPHVSTGDIFRRNVGERTTLGLAAQRFMNAGDYVPDEITNAMVADRLAQDDARHAFILDGYPRTLDQVAVLDELLAEAGATLQAVVELVVESDELLQRLVMRARTGGRADDTEDVIRHRQEVYSRQTAPLLEVYAGRGILRPVEGSGQIEVVSDRIDAALATIGPISP